MIFIADSRYSWLSDCGRYRVSVCESRGRQVGCPWFLGDPPPTPKDPRAPVEIGGEHHLVFDTRQDAFKAAARVCEEHAARRLGAQV